MYCPECGSDAGEANFCPECGTDLRDLAGEEVAAGVCPECGTDAGDANFCPECGTRLAGEPAPPRGARPAQPTRAASVSSDEDGSGRTRQQRRQAERRAAQKAAQRRPAPARAGASRGGHPQRSSTWLIWGGFAVAAVVVVLIIVGLGGGDGAGSGSAGAPGGGTSPPAVTADTSGSYSELVARANGLYDQGSAAFQDNDVAGGREYFAAAAKVYAAAWKKQPGDPNVGTDFATSLFYSGDTERALEQVDEVLTASPDFQTAHLNRGIFLRTAAQDATDAGDSAQAEKLLADAKASFEKAVSIDAGSDPGQRAAQELDQL